MTKPPIKVAICDDSAIVRRILRTVIDGADGMEVVAEGANGAEGVQIANKADVLLIDVEMPVCDGIEAVERIRAAGNKISVIMFSSLTERGAEATLEALAAGANDFACKPSLTGSPAAAVAHVRSELVPRIESWGRLGRAAARNRPSPPTTPAPVSRPSTSPFPTASSDRFECVTVGVSTGGPDALQRFVGSLPDELSIPIVIVQHMPANFTARLAEQLDRIGTIRVVEATHGMPLEANTVYVAPGGKHLEFGGSPLSRTLVTSDAPPVQSCRPSVDVLFQSAAATFGRRLLSIVMTGMGQDGLDGAHAVTKAGGTIVVQDEVSCVVWGMPRVVWEAGLAKQQLPPEQLAQWVDRHCGRPKMAV